MNQGMGMRVRAWALALAMVAALPATAAEVSVPRAAYTLQADVQGDGPVAVVFESGFGQGAGVWKDVVDGLGAECRCIAYGRAGLGGSGTDGNAKTIDQHLADLDAVIATVAPGRKVVLVGHSYGGLLASEFARQHPDRLQGLVLVDPATMGQRHAFRQADPARVQADDAALLSMLPPAMAGDYRALIAQLDSAEAAAPRVMPDVPVGLLTATQVAAEPFVFEETAQGKALWKAQHAALFAAFSRGTHRYLDTGHNLHREDPAAVVDAIRTVVAMASASE
jgi:pimeloyl-ACP methyl ester carboxylesterase